MNPPPVDERRPPLVVRYLLGNVRTRTSAVRLVVVTVIFVGVAIAFQDPVLVGIAVIGVVAYAWSIIWMDHHDGWKATADASELAEVAAVAAAADVADVAAGSALGRMDNPLTSRLAARAVAALVVVATIAYLWALATLEAGGDDPTGGHLVEVTLDALFGIGFGTFGVVVILRRERLPRPHVLSAVAAAGLGLVGGLGYFIAVGVAAADAAGPGAIAAWLIGAAASGAGVWLAATSGGRGGLVLAIPAVLFGWLLGLAAWVAHINAV